MSDRGLSLPNRMTAGLSPAAWLGRNGGLAALVVLLLFNILVTPNFLHAQTLAVNIS